MLSTFALVLLPFVQASRVAPSLPPPAERPPLRIVGADADGDGDEDLVTFRAGEGGALLENLGEGGFADVTRERGLHIDAGVRDVLWQDLDGDGRADLLEAGEVTRVWLQEPDGSFSDGTPDAGLAPGAVVLAAAALDLDRDGAMDLVLDTQGGLQAWRNRRGRFEAVPVARAERASSPAPLAVAAGTDAGEPRADGASGAPPATLALDRPRRPGAAPAPVARPESGPGAGAPQPVLLDALGPLGDEEPALACAAALRDQAGGGCLLASSAPALGRLYPLGQELSIDPAGRVGIGTVAPAATLDVAGSAPLALVVRGAAALLEAGVELLVADELGAPRQALAATDDLLVGVDAWSQVVLGPGGNVCIDAAGRLGIGVPLPAVPLHVRGAGGDALQVDEGALRLGSGAGIEALDDASVARTALSCFGTDDLYLGPDSWQTLFLGASGNVAIDPAGGVGIGTVSPDAPLEVRGTGSDALLVDEGALRLGPSAGIEALDATEVPRTALTCFGTDDLYVGPDAWQRLFLGPGGNVSVDGLGHLGVGTVSAGTPLEVHGTGAEAVRVDLGALRLGPSASLEVEDGASASRLALTSFGTDELYLAPDTWQRLFVGPGGNVVVDALGRLGVGTPTPDAPLEVRGTGSDAVRVDQGALRLGPSASLEAEDTASVSRLALTSFGTDELYLAPDTWQRVVLGPTASVTIDGAGNVGLGVASPANVLTVEQGSATDPIADAWTTYSSRRWKEDVRPIEDALDAVLALRGVRYRWRESGRADLGFVAEEVGQVVPELVQYEENGVDARSVDYARVTALLVEAVKAQEAAIATLRAEVASLRARRP